MINAVCEDDSMTRVSEKDSMMNNSMADEEQCDEVCLKDIKELCTHNKKGYTRSQEIDQK